MNKVCTLVIFSFLMMIFPTLSMAQVDYPISPIQISIGYAAGGSVDILSRGLAQEAKKHLKQEIIITYKPGATGTLSLAHVVGAKPDGYTLGICPSSTFTNAPIILDLGFDPFKETIPIVAFAKMHNTLAVRADSPFKTLKDFLDFAKQNPGKATYGHPGVGTGNHLTMMAIAAQEKINMNFVAFPGDAPAITTLLGGHIMAAAGTVAAYVPHIQAGTLKIIATYEEERLDEYSEVPSIAELGYPYTPRFWIFLYGPMGLSDPVLKKLEDAFGKASQSPAFKELTISNGVYLKKIIFREELFKNLLAEKAKIADLFQKAGIKKK